MEAPSHSTISPPILYWGTPVVIVSSQNEDGTDNLAAISSAFWLGHRCILGFSGSSKTPSNILRTRQCVVNLPDASMVGHINGLALTTGTDPVPDWKKSNGYHFIQDKWSAAGLTPQPSVSVAPARVRECPVQMECELAMEHPMFQDKTNGLTGRLVAIELRVVKVHVVDSIRLEGYSNRIDPDKWQPLIMSFQHFYGLSGPKIAPSKLAGVDEEAYRPLADADTDS
jgi:flavin reductase (DIM6/NTAB) family NADH-FMN oxidoreductase RutF